MRVCSPSLPLHILKTEETEMSRGLARFALFASVWGWTLGMGDPSPFQAVAESESLTPALLNDVEVTMDFSDVQIVTQPATQRAKRPWGPEQAAGPPDSEGAGDFQTAWASLTADSQKEWLECEYAEAVMPTALVVHANDAPGSLERVSVFDEAGKEIEVWTGTDPTPRTAARGTSVILIKTDFKVKKVKVYLDSPAVPGWNEIDAVGLRVKDKEEILWAMNVTASSTYAAGFATATVTVPADQLESLKADVKGLKTEMEQLHSDMAELKELIKSLKQDK
jgi:hypothetical protein